MSTVSEPETPTPATAALARLVARKTNGEARPGQVEMCQAVEAALGRGRHLLVEAPTGTGKSLAYLVPAVLSAVTPDAAPDNPSTGTDDDDRRTVIVVTATKALQEQLINDDLPFVAEAMAADGVTFSVAMLKGRSNYLCRSKLAVSLTDGIEARLDFGEAGPAGAMEAVKALGEWADQTDTGDRAEAPLAVTDAVWSQVSVDATECPGATRCPDGPQCFAEAARDRAARAQVVVVNTHLYATHVAAGGGVLPPHHAVVFDEGHTVEDTVSSVAGLRLSGGRIRRLASRLRGAGGDSALAGRLERIGGALEEALELVLGDGSEARVRPGEALLADAFAAAALLAADASADLRRITPADDVAKTKAAHAARLVDDLRGDLALLAEPDVYKDHVAWIERGGPGGRPELHLATIDVGPLLAGRLYPQATVVATSATLATAGRFHGLAQRLGLTLPAPDAEAHAAAPHSGPAPAYDTLVVDSPFDHRRQGLLYVPLEMPDPRHEGFTAAVHEELHTLVTAAGGRTLALFTSRAAMEAAATALESKDTHEVLVQDRLPRAELLGRFRTTPGSVLVATQSFWSGIDLPGSLCHLVTIDRIPFPRPTDPLHQARREAATTRREDGFTTVDLPAAATRLAQGVGRLIRSTTDEGVVAVFDRRLATARYRATLLDTLPRFTRTTDRARVVETLARLAADAAAAAV